MWDIVQDNSSNLFCKSMSYFKKRRRTVLNQFSQLEMILSSGGHLTMSGDISDSHSVSSGTGIQGVEVKDAAIHLTTHRTAPTPTPTINIWSEMSIVPLLRKPVLKEIEKTQQSNLVSGSYLDPGLNKPKPQKDIFEILREI